MAEVRSRRSCLSVPASSPRMLAKAPGLPADEVMLDLEDSVTPALKQAARDNVIRALREGDWSAKTVAVRVNGVATRWCYRDIIDVVSAAGQHIHCLVVPKVTTPRDVAFVASLLRMVEEDSGITRPLGIEAQVEDAAGVQAAGEIAAASGRLETLIFGPGDMAASLGMPSVTIGESSPEYPGDQWHWILGTILVAARAAGLQAIDGPYGRIRDLAGFRESAGRSYRLGYDGKWVLHPGQISLANEIYTPGQDDFDRAAAILDAYGAAAAQHLGAVSFGNEMIDEASRKMAERVAAAGRAAGMTRQKSWAQFEAEWAEQQPLS